MVLQALTQREGHMTAEEIHARVQKAYPFIDLATVYRTLQLFKRLHLVTEIDLGTSATQYELAGSGRHHHLICRGCGATFDLPLDYLDGLSQSLRQEFSFEPDLENFTVSGLCGPCARSKTAPGQSLRGPKERADSSGAQGRGRSV
jgi:Fe2+ or Zn2+ uptake regulation protein